MEPVHEVRGGRRIVDLDNTFHEGQVTYSFDFFFQELSECSSGGIQFQEFLQFNNVELVQIRRMWIQSGGENLIMMDTSKNIIELILWSGVLVSTARYVMSDIYDMNAGRTSSKGCEDSMELIVRWMDAKIVESMATLNLVPVAWRRPAVGGVSVVRLEPMGWG